MNIEFIRSGFMGFPLVARCYDEQTGKGLGWTTDEGLANLIKEHIDNNTIERVVVCSIGSQGLATRIKSLAVMNPTTVQQK